VDRRALRRNFNHAARSFAEGDALHREVGTRMQERLGYIKLDVRAALDLGCATGGALPGLRERYPQAALTALDFALDMVRCAVPAPGLLDRLRARVQGARQHATCADMAALPFVHGSFDLVWSNPALHWLDDPAPAVREAHRVLRSGGLFMFSTLGPDSLKELRAAWGEADADTVPAAWRVKRFIDLHDIGDLLLKSGFATPVMDMESIVLTYEQIDKLLDDLGNTGSVSAMLGRPRGLTGKSAWSRMRSAYEQLRCDGRLPATFEVVYGHAWKAPPRQTAGGAQIVRFAERGASGGR
jgi:malonyl-CoA O-methyltransferase